MSLRRAALLAAIAQALMGIYCFWPQVLGSGSAIVADQGMPSVLARSIGIFALAGVLVFYVVVYLKGGDLLVIPLSKSVALVAAFAIGIQNVPMAMGNARALFYRSQDMLLWQYHFFQQLRDVARPLIPTLWVISTILFLVATYRRPATATREASAGGHTRPAAAVRVASVLAAAAAALELGAALYVSLHFHVFTLPSGIQVVIYACLLLFFILMSKSQAPIPVAVATPEP